MSLMLKKKTVFKTLFVPRSCSLENIFFFVQRMLPAGNIRPIYNDFCYWNKMYKIFATLWCASKPSKEEGKQYFKNAVAYCINRNKLWSFWFRFPASSLLRHRNVTVAPNHWHLISWQDHSLSSPSWGHIVLERILMIYFLLIFVLFRFHACCCCCCFHIHHFFFLQKLRSCWKRAN